MKLTMFRKLRSPLFTMCRQWREQKLHNPLRIVANWHVSRVGINVLDIGVAGKLKLSGNGICINFSNNIWNSSCRLDIPWAVFVRIPSS